MSAYSQKWGYKGTETALNGLVNWVFYKTDYSGYGLFNDRCEKVYKLIIKYGKQNYPNLPYKGHAATKARNVAKQVQKDKKFQHFVQFVFNEIKVLKELETGTLPVMIVGQPGVGKTKAALETIKDLTQLNQKQNLPQMLLRDELDKATNDDLKAFVSQ
jgi:hypothetical protein